MQTSDLIIGLAEHLHAEGVGTWRPDGIFDPGQTGIVLGSMPAEPDRCIVLSPYPVSDDLTGASTLGIQARTRGSIGSPLDETDLADRLYQLLHGAERLTLGGVHVPLMWRQSRTLMGRDDSYRWEGSSNFYAYRSHPTPHTR